MSTKSAMCDRFPVHEELEVLDGVTIFKSADWWKAVLLNDGFSGREICVYLWKRVDGDWKRKQKYVIRSKDDWKEEREAIVEFLGELDKG